MINEPISAYQKCPVPHHIPMLNLGKQYQSIKEEINEAIAMVLESGAYINGPQLAQFEENIARFLGVKNAVGVASGSDALVLALHVLGIGPGDKVIVPAFTFIATAEAVSRVGAVPVFADIDPFTYNLSPGHMEQILEQIRGIKAVIPVHLFGLPANMEQIIRIASKYHLYVIEDACQAINATFEYKAQTVKAGSLGVMGCFSFFPSKNLGCFGDGGMLVTNNDEMADNIKLLKEHGAKPKYFHRFIGYNSRLDTLQAAILNVKLGHLETWTRQRREVAACYNEAFIESGMAEQFVLPGFDKGHVFNQYVIQSEYRDEIILHLQNEGIATAIYYPYPLHLQEAYQDLGYRIGSLPMAEQTCKRVLALPIDPCLTVEQITHITARICSFVRSKLSGASSQR